MSPEQEDVLIDLLRQVKEVLDEHNIDFWLDCGTLLGAVREDKFLDWEHDIDLGACQEKMTDTAKILISKELHNRKFVVASFENYIHIEKETFHADINLYHLCDGKAVMSRSGPVSLFDRFLYYLSMVISSPHDLKLDPGGTTFTKRLIKASLVKISLALPSLLRKPIYKIVATVYTNICVKDVSWVIPSDYFINLSTIKFYGMEFKVPAKKEEYLAYRYGEDWRTPRRGWTTNKDDGAVRSLDKKEP